jgi:hypothetical protein
MLPILALCLCCLASYAGWLDILSGYAGWKFWMAMVTILGRLSGCLCRTSCLDGGL